MININDNVFTSIKKALYSRNLTLAIIISAITFAASLMGHSYLSQAKIDEPIYFIPEKNAKKYSKVQIQILTDMVASTNTSKMYYIVADDNDYYIVQLEHSKFEELKEIHDYTYSKIDKAPKPVTITGMPVKIDDELFNILNESFNELYNENLSSTEFRDIIGYTYLDTSLTPITHLKTFTVILSILSLLALIICGRIWIISFRRNSNFINTYDRELEENLNAQFADAVIYKKLKLMILKDYLIFDYRGMWLIPIRDIVWIYPEDHSVNSKPNHKCIILELKNGKKYAVANTKKYMEMYKEVYQILSEHAPEAMKGYTPENINAFKGLTR